MTQQELSISIGTEYDEELRPNAEAERLAWEGKRELPEHFIQASAWLHQQIKTEGEFYREHKGDFVSVISLNPPVMEINRDAEELRKKVTSRWGYRPVLIYHLDQTEYQTGVCVGPRFENGDN
ncbi:MAG: hypothetical protein Q7R49_00675 [Candidatus Daviesbacteria bacterium]|nr:hypothetical protein [Candidatus Daviesbacteria bacterium]